jgi:hypothetical protein
MPTTIQPQRLSISPQTAQGMMHRENTPSAAAPLAGLRKESPFCLAPLDIVFSATRKDCGSNDPIARSKCVGAVCVGEPGAVLDHVTPADQGGRRSTTTSD